MSDPRIIFEAENEEGFRIEVSRYKGNFIFRAMNYRGEGHIIRLTPEDMERLEQALAKSLQATNTSS